jgi:hypothetical protein
MVTNINLVSQESENKSMLTGKSTLFVSITLVILSIIAYGAVNYLGKNYASKAASQETEIQAEKAKLSSPNYKALADFQERNVLIGKIVDDHSTYEGYFTELSKYILPDLRVTQISISEDDSSLSLSGITQNYETLSRGIILLQKFPGVSSVEFKNAGASKSNDESQGGLSFSLSAKINKSSLKASSSNVN